VATGAVVSGTFAPNANALNSVYTPSNAEIGAGSLWLFLTSTGNGGCNAARDSVQMFFTPAPTVNAGANTHVCASAADVVLNGAVTVATGGAWSGGAGSFNPNNTLLNATYTPSLGEIAAGQVTLTLTTTGIGNCLAVQDQMVTTIDPIPVVNAGPDQSICANNPNLQLNGFVGNAPGGASGAVVKGHLVSGATATGHAIPCQRLLKIASGFHHASRLTSARERPTAPPVSRSDDDHLHRCTDRGRW
jgi:hypothetical protein